MFSLFQLFGHQRSPSMEFKELTKKDAQISLALELDKLVRTCSEGEKQVPQLAAGQLIRR